MKSDVFLRNFYKTFFYFRYFAVKKTLRRKIAKFFFICFNLRHLCKKNNSWFANFP